MSIDRPLFSLFGWRKPFILCAALSLALPLLQGCAAAVVAAGVGAVAGATTMIRDRRSQDAILADTQIELQSREWPGFGSKCQVAVNSYNRVVLLTGQCQNDAAARAFADRVSRVPKVSRVNDEITIGPFADLKRQGDDSVITTRAKMVLLEVKLEDFDPTRVKVITESGVVYLMGLVTDAEAKAAIEKIRYLPGILKVVELFEIIPAPPVSPPGSKQAATNFHETARHPSDNERLCRGFHANWHELASPTPENERLGRDFHAKVPAGLPRPETNLAVVKGLKALG